jgi:hypothetical protein
VAIVGQAVADVLEDPRAIEDETFWSIAARFIRP